MTASVEPSSGALVVILREEAVVFEVTGYRCPTSTPQHPYLPALTLEAQHRDLSIARGARKHGSEVIGRPRDRVDASRVQRVLLDTLPAVLELAAAALALSLSNLLPNKDAAVV
jgi:hypothetical protein